MGTWGTAIFSDDLAADIRDFFTDLIGEGLETDAATERLLSDSAEELADQDDADIVWLALAATQWRLGRLVDAVRDNALEVIDSGRNLARWQDEAPRQVPSRRKYLDKLREQLLSPPPAPRRVKRRVKSSTSFMPGDIVRYQVDEQTAVVFSVMHISQDRGGEYASIRLLYRDDGRRFDPDDFGPDLAGRDPWSGPVRRNFVMIGHEPVDRIRIIARGVTLPDRRTPGMIALGIGGAPGGIACVWKDFDTAVLAALLRLGW